MTPTPQVSVVVAAYQAEAFLRASIDSLLTQTFTDFELVVIDDASTDGTSQILASYRDPRLRVLRNPQNVGLSGSLNLGLAAATAPLIARLDADDIAEPTRLERQLTAMRQRPELDVLGTWTTEIDESGRSIGQWSLPASEALVRWGMACTNVIFHPTVLMRRASVEAVGRYDESHRWSQDYDLFTRMLACGHRIDTLPERLVRYRRSTGQMSTAHADEQRERGRDIRRAYLHWLVGESPTDPVLDAMSMLRTGLDGFPAELTEDVVALERRIRLRCLSGSDAAGRRQIRRISRRLFFHQAAQMRLRGHAREARLLWREGMACGWQSACNREGLRQAVLLAPTWVLPRSATT